MAAGSRVHCPGVSADPAKRSTARCSRISEPLPVTHVALQAEGRLSGLPLPLPLRVPKRPVEAAAAAAARTSARQRPLGPNAALLQQVRERSCGTEAPGAACIFQLPGAVALKADIWSGAPDAARGVPRQASAGLLNPG